MATASELLKDLPSRNSTNFSQYNHSSFKCESKKYVKLKTHEDAMAVKVIEMDEASMLKRELAKLNQSSKKPVKRSSERAGSSHGRSSKYLRRDEDEEGEGQGEGHSIDDDDSDQEENQSIPHQ